MPQNSPVKSVQLNEFQYIYRVLRPSPYSNFGIFLSPQRETSYPLSIVFSLQPLATIDLWIWLFWIFCIYMELCNVRLLCLASFTRRVLQAHSCCSVCQEFSPFYVSNIPLYARIYHILFTQPSVDGYLSCFHFYLFIF